MVLEGHHVLLLFIAGTVDEPQPVGAAGVSAIYVVGLRPFTLDLKWCRHCTVTSDNKPSLGTLKEKWTMEVNYIYIYTTMYLVLVHNIEYVITNLNMKV